MAALCISTNAKHQDKEGTKMLDKEKRDKIIDKLNGWFEKLELETEDVYIILSILKGDYFALITETEEELETEEPEEVEEDLEEEPEEVPTIKAKPITKHREIQKERTQAMKTFIKKPQINVRGKANTPTQEEIDGGQF